MIRTKPTPTVRRALVCAAALLSTAGATLATAPSAAADFPGPNKAFYIKTSAGKCLKHTDKKVEIARVCMIGAADQLFYRYVKTDGFATVRTAPKNGSCVIFTGDLASGSLCDLADKGQPRAETTLGHKQMSNGNIKTKTGLCWDANGSGPFNIGVCHGVPSEKFTFEEY